MAARLWARMSMSMPRTGGVWLWVEYRALLGGIAVIEQGEHGGAEDQRSAVGDAGLDDQVGLDLPDDLLYRHHVLWLLDDRAAEPGEVVGVLGSQR